jgi:hypothetical protein
MPEVGGPGWAGMPEVGGPGWAGIVETGGAGVDAAETGRSEGSSGVGAAGFSSRTSEI